MSGGSRSTKALGHVCTGILEVDKRGERTARFFVLLPGDLSYYAQEDDYLVGRPARGNVVLAEVTKAEVSGNSIGLHLRAQKKPLQLVIPSRADVARWVAGLRDVLEPHVLAVSPTPQTTPSVSPRDAAQARPSASSSAAPEEVERWIEAAAAAATRKSLQASEEVPRPTRAADRGAGAGAILEEEEGEEEGQEEEEEVAEEDDEEEAAQAEEGDGEAEAEEEEEEAPAEKAPYLTGRDATAAARSSAGRRPAPQVRLSTGPQARGSAGPAPKLSARGPATSSSSSSSRRSTAATLPGNGARKQTLPPAPPPPTPPPASSPLSKGSSDSGASTHYEKPICWGRFSLVGRGSQRTWPKSMALYKDRLECLPEGVCKPEATYPTRDFTQVAVLENGFVISMRMGFSLTLEGEEGQPLEVMERWKDGLFKVCTASRSRPRTPTMSSRQAMSADLPEGWTSRTESKLLEVFQRCEDDRGLVTRASLLELCRASPLTAEFFGLRETGTSVWGPAPHPQVSELDAIFHSMGLSATGGLTWEEFRASFIPRTPDLLLQGTVSLSGGGGAAALAFFRVLGDRLEYAADLRRPSFFAGGNRFLTVSRYEVRAIRPTDFGFMVFLSNGALSLHILADDSVELWTSALQSFYGGPLDDIPREPRPSAANPVAGEPGGCAPSAGSRSGSRPSRCPSRKSRSVEPQDPGNPAKFKPSKKFLEELDSPLMEEFCASLQPPPDCDGILWWRDTLTNQLVPRLCALWPDRMEAFDRPLDFPHGLRPTVLLPMSEVRSLESINTGLLFQLRSGRLMAVTAGSEKELWKWARAFAKLLEPSRRTSLTEPPPEEVVAPRPAPQRARSQGPAQLAEVDRDPSPRPPPYAPAPQGPPRHLAFDPQTRRATLRTPLVYLPRSFGARDPSAEFTEPGLARAVLAEVAMLWRGAGGGGRLDIYCCHQAPVVASLGQEREQWLQAVALMRAERVKRELTNFGLPPNLLFAHVGAGGDDHGLGHVFAFGGNAALMPPPPAGRRGRQLAATKPAPG